jgi:hypothetical protein
LRIVRPTNPNGLHLFLGSYFPDGSHPVEAMAFELSAWKKRRAVMFFKNSLDWLRGAEKEGEEPMFLIQSSLVSLSRLLTTHDLWLSK